ncbi:MAG: hypothetical protein ACREDY_05880, partial [Bradyrhizobium sp.]
MRSTFRALIPASLLLTVAAGGPAPRPAHFSLIVQRSGSTWTATCQAGCHWGSLSATKPQLTGSTILIDNGGVSLWSTSADSAATFAFKVTA